MTPTTRKGLTMKRISTLGAMVVIMAVGALSLSPAAVGGTSCPLSCEPVGPRLDEGRVRGEQQRVRPTPRIAFELGGQSVWRAGSHLMY
jgi:hypothetical protein